MGNPPFNGQYTKSFEQTADMKLVWGTQYDGYLDYLTAWFKKASDYFEAVNGALHERGCSRLSASVAG